MLLIGFGNKARHGKDSAANAIKEYFEKHYYNGFMAPQVRVGIFKYATALYAEVNSFLDVVERGRKLNNAGDHWQDYSLPFGEGHIQIPEWVQPEPNPEISALAPYGKHPKLLQWWGTEYRRAQDENYWVKKTFAAIPVNLDIAMITDVRFPNEVEGVRSRRGYTVNVQRLREDRTSFEASDRPATHPSETAVDDPKYWDFFLKIPNGHAALLGELSITLAVYLRGLVKR